MIKIQDVVRNIVESDEEALFALSHGYMNFSAYAKSIQKTVEEKTHKEVKTAGIVVALSRIQKNQKETQSMIQDVKINNITVKSPLAEIVFEKNQSLLSKLSSLYAKIKTTGADFLTMTLSTNEITVICSEHIKDRVIKHLKNKPRIIKSSLASIGLSLDPKYYEMPNITFSLIREIAKKRIVLAETITTHTEIIFVFNQKDLAEIVKLFSVE